MKNDTQIQQEVLAELENDETLPAGSIGVEVHHGVEPLNRWLEMEPAVHRQN
jgi:hypothetical protein